MIFTKNYERNIAVFTLDSHFIRKLSSNVTFRWNNNRQVAAISVNGGERQLNNEQFGLGPQLPVFLRFS